MKPAPAVILLAATLALAACKGQPAQDSNASGQVLPGSISDEMLPADRVTSQPPLDPRTERTGAASAAGPAATSAPSATATEPATEASPTPAPHAEVSRPAE